LERREPKRKPIALEFNEIKRKMKAKLQRRHIWPKYCPVSRYMGIDARFGSNRVKGMSLNTFDMK
jgi:hypothetical protein